MNTLPHWWQNGVIYQIYPKSFQDTTGSGTGDLRGVTQRLDYLKTLGIDAIWLTPFYISPQVDNGYDVANYTAIDPTYGTLDDFDELVARAHERGIRIVLDMVFNHTSTQHAWFRESLDKASPYRQFYIWRDGTPDTLPNNWRSKFGGNAWRWHAESEQYYLQEMSRDVFTPRNLMTVGEMSSTSLENCQQYASLDGRELSMTFNFHHLKVDYPGGEKWTKAKPDFVALKTLFRHWQQGMHNKAWNALFWCNHDQPRIVSRFGDEGEHRVAAAKMLGMVLHGMQGTPYIYQGEELGMTNPHFSRITDYRDVESLNMFAEQRANGRDTDELLAILASKSRDNGRTPMQWDASHNAGFTEAEPWIGVCDNYETVNARAALDDPNSVFYTYQSLIRLRKTLSVLTWGDYEDLLPDHPSLWCYRRQWQGQTLMVVANLSHARQQWQPVPVEGAWRVALSNYEEVPFRPDTLLLRPFEAIWWVQE